MQYILIDFVSLMTLSIICAICLWRWPKSYCIWTIMTMMVAFPHVAIIYHIYWLISFINSLNMLSWVPEIFGYDVGFVDVVKFGYRNFYDTNFSVFTRLYFFSVLHNIILLCLLCVQFCLILADATAIGIRLSHASRKNLDSWRTAQ